MQLPPAPAPSCGGWMPGRGPAQPLAGAWPSFPAWLGCVEGGSLPARCGSLVAVPWAASDSNSNISGSSGPLEGAAAMTVCAGHIIAEGC